MKQVFIRKGKVIVDEVPAPLVSANEVLVHVYYSCISSGTEVSGIEKSGKPLFKKIIDKPQNIRKVLDLLRNKGLSETIRKVKSKVDSKTPTGYSASGLVLEVGDNIKNIKVGDKVACAGAGIANHAEFIAAPENLVARIPENLSLKYASTVTLGSIALQGVRRCKPELGEFVVVIGLGILGQLTMQLLKLSGCNVIGIDLEQKRLDKALSLGLDMGFNPNKVNIVEEIIRSTNGYGADSAVITASSASSAVINQAMEMCRKKGKVVVVGDVSLNIERKHFYEKELDLLISTSYGPGRYDEKYELKGYDYPYAYVRWTENRNMKEYLSLLSENKINVKDLIEEVYKVEEAPKAFESLRRGGSKPLVVLLEYHRDLLLKERIVKTSYKIRQDKINVGVIGAGSFTREVHLPNLERLNKFYNIYAICCKSGNNAKSLAKQFGAVYATTDYTEILMDKNIDMVLISTRHNLHAKIAIDAANAGKAIFLEKPMALIVEELSKLIDTLEKTKVLFMVGFNRRFSPFALKIKEIISNRVNPIMVNYIMNAGFIPKDHWVHTEEGGGRNIGEACHIYDLFNYFTVSEVSLISAFSISPKTEQFNSNDNFVATIKYKDGSVCNLVYTALGSKEIPKEQVEIYVDGKIIYLNDYKELNFFGLNEKRMKKNIQDKGHYNELKYFGENIKNNKDSFIIPLWQLIQATEISFEVEKQIYENYKAKR
ncbi:MAG: bi-domain-containing oxidoreductase [Thermodesulfovibrionales bacterium]